MDGLHSIVRFAARRGGRRNTSELPMMEPDPVDLPGPWLRGFALGMHSQDSDEGALTTAGELLDRFKYGGQRDTLRIIAPAMARVMVSLPEYAGVHVVLHVPSTPRRAAVEPALDLAKALSKRLRIPWLPRFIARTREVKPQKDIASWEDKQRNVRGAFRVRRPEFVRGRKVLLVDDVYDSGATLEEACRVLKEAGVAEVVVATVTTTRYRRGA